MKVFFKESFIPVLLVLAIVFGTLAVLRQIAETHSRTPSVIKISAKDVQLVVASADAAESSGRPSLLDLQNGTASTSKDLVDRAMEMASRDSLAEALALVTELIDSNPQTGRSWFAKGLLLSRMDRRNDAIAAYEKAVSLTGGVEQAIPLYNLACLYRDAGMDTRAIQTFRKAIEQRPNYLEARLNLAILVSKQKGSHDEAYALYDQLIRLDSTYVRAYFNRGVLRMGDDETDLAISDFRRTVQLDPKFSKAWYNMGLLQSRQKRYEDAEAAYRSAIAADPQNMKARLNLAVTLSRQEKYEEAAKDYEAIVRDDPTYAEAWVNLGLAYSRLNTLDKAKDSYQRALKLEPSNNHAWVNLGVVYAKMKDDKKAVECYKRALEITPEDASARYNLGLAYRRMGDLQAALDEGMKVYRLDPDRAKNRNFVRATATMILEKTPADKKAQEVLRQVPEGGESAEDVTTP